MSEQVVQVERLTKAYGKTKALDQVSFTLEEGKIYGLLGRNGAGKTTLMHLLTAQLFLSGGSIRLFGEEPYENERVLRRVCFIKESQQYPKSLRLEQLLELAAQRYPQWHQPLAEQLLDDFKLPKSRRVKQLSRGMLSAAGIIVGLASRAPLTIFDEPYLGLDAPSRHLFYDRLLEDYSEHPRTILLSTHLIDEISRLLEHVLVLEQGRLLLDEDAEHLRSQAFTVSGPSAQVKRFVEGRQVLKEEVLGVYSTATVWGEHSTEMKRKAEALALDIGPVSLQQLIVHISALNASMKAKEERQ